MSPWLLSIVLLSSATAEADPVEEAVAKLLPAGVEKMAIYTTPLSGIKEVVLGTQVFYVSEDGSYLLAGALISLRDNQNLSERRMSAARLDILNDTRLSNPISYLPPKPHYLVTVVTNIDCGYCRAMHARIQEYLDLGIQFDYVMTASGRPQTPAYDKTASLLCAPDPAAAVTDAMNSGAVSGTPGCTHNLDEHLQLAQALGANTTPNLILPDGQLIRGFVAPDQLLLALEAGGDVNN